MKINKLSPEKHIFLQIVASIAKPPESLYFMGTLPAERPPTIAIVGTRKPTSYGKEVTYRFAHDLAARGVVIVSGLALGIDGIAHRAALDARGTTIAILANGLPGIYPATHRELGQAIVRQGGALISEYEPESRPHKYQFLERNRIVSGVSDAILITEASARSGTLNTAMYALEQGKDVMVVPGNITSPESAGCNALLKQGAHPVTSVDDIMALVAPWLQPAASLQTALPLGDTPAETQLIALIAGGLRDGDTLQRTSKLPVEHFSTTLTMLEIKGIIRSLGGNKWTLR